MLDADRLPPDLARHVRACNNAELPGRRLRLRLGGAAIGWMLPEDAEAVLRRGATRTDRGDIEIGDAARLGSAARALAEAGRYPIRGELFDVRERPEGPVLASLDRGALSTFGIQAVGAHLNGLVRRGDETFLWVGKRANDRLLDPGKLDNLAAGGVAAGMTPDETLIKEAEEEAAIPRALSTRAVPSGRIEYAMERPEGLRRDLLHLYDLELPENFQPRSTDGEIVAFELWPIGRVLDTVRQGDAFKFNVNLVLIDLFVRLGIV